MSGLVGFIGLGVMGAPMAGALAAAGWDVRAYDTRAEALARAAEHPRVVAATSAADAAAGAPLVVSMLPDNDPVRAALLGEDGAASGAKPGAVFVDMSTISPVVAREIHAALSERGIGFVDAPVSGGVVGAQKGALTIMAGGDDADVAAARPALEVMGASLTHAGGPGMGQLFKLCNQIICVGNLTALSEALSLCRAGGGDAAALLDALGGGAAGSWMLENLAPKMIAGDASAGFTIDLQLKDLRLVQEAAFAMDAPLPATSLITSLYLAARANGCSKDGNQAVFKVLDLLANRESRHDT